MTDDFDGNLYTFAVSREYAVDHGMVEPTDDERARAAEGTIEHNARLAVQWDAVEREAPLVLAMRDDPDQIVAGAVLRMHDCAREPDTGVPRPWAKCVGCPTDEDGDGPEWPCETVQEVIAAVHGARLTDVPWRPRPAFGPVRNPLPWPRAKIRDLFPNAFTSLASIDFTAAPPPPKPAPAPEPSALLAEVTDLDGRTWVRYHTDPTGRGRHWWHAGGFGWRAYRDLDLPLVTP